MSGRLASQVYRRTLTEGQQRILINLALHADDITEACWPGTRLIALEVGCSERYVRQVLSQLEGLGAITTAHRQGGRGHRTQYTIHLNELPLKGELQDTKTEPQFRVAPTQRGNSETLKGELSNTDILIGTVKEPSLVKAHPWIDVMLADERFKRPPDSWIEVVERKIPNMDDLILLAHNCLFWLQNNPKGKRRKKFVGTFNTFMKPSGDRNNGPTRNASTESDAERTARFRRESGLDKDWSNVPPRSARSVEAP